MPLAAADGGAPYDSVLIQSFGGPVGPDDVDPFLANVLRGREVNAERLDEIRSRYLVMGGISPITAQTQALRDALDAALQAAGLDVPVYVGSRNWRPFLADTLASMYAAGARRALVVVTSAYSSYSGCRQYREDRENAQLVAGAGALTLDRIRHYFDHPGFVEVMVDNVNDALDSLDLPGTSSVRLLFSTHSLPQVLADASGPGVDGAARVDGVAGGDAGAGGAYVAQHRATAAAIVDRLAVRRSVRYDWELVFQSRSGAPSTPWLEPDVNDRIDELGADRVNALVLVPIGFVSDHMEVVWDLDREATQRALDLGLVVARAATVGTHPRFVAGLVELIKERLDPSIQGQTVRRACSALGPSWDVCDPACCLPPARVRPPVTS